MNFPKKIQFQIIRFSNCFTFQSDLCHQSKKEQNNCLKTI